LAHLLHPPALAQVGEIVARAGHGLLVGAAPEPEHELGVCPLDDVAAADEAIAVERSTKGQSTGLGDHRLVEVEKRGAAPHGGQV